MHTALGAEQGIVSECHRAGMLISTDTGPMLPVMMCWVHRDWPTKRHSKLEMQEPGARPACVLLLGKGALLDSRGLSAVPSSGVWRFSIL